VIWWWLADDRSLDAKWLEPSQAAELEAALTAEQLGVKHVRDYRTAFRDPQVILFCIQFFAWSVGIYGLNMWLPVIVKQGSQLGMGNVGLLTAGPYAIGAAVMVGIGAISDRLLIRKPFVWPFMFVGAIAFVGSYVAGTQHFWWSFTGLIIACICMYAPYGPYWAMIPEMVSRNVVGESMALINTCGAAGGFVGTFGVGALYDLTHSYAVSFACLGMALAAAGFLTIAIRARDKGTIPVVETVARNS
jgi:nitrate/nitrite transporter NarK